MSTSALFVFRKDHQAMVTFDGSVGEDGKAYRIQRTLTFRYSHITGGNISCQ
ncbi:hypothetical protein [Enterobacter cloacae]|uniref:hypothetical protein n=1 Tax=Enterobacter cloacae TaxID=550 RepID=UPI0015FE47C8|nr:hypothetical protein [Enterobacter cloacae]